MGFYGDWRDEITKPKDNFYLGSLWRSEEKGYTSFGYLLNVNGNNIEFPTYKEALDYKNDSGE